MKEFSVYLEKVSIPYFEIYKYVESFRYKNNHLEIGDKQIDLEKFKPDDFGKFSIKNRFLTINYKEKDYVFNTSNSVIDDVYSDVYDKEYDYTDLDHSYIFSKIYYAIIRYISDKEPEDDFFQIEGNRIYVRDLKSTKRHYISMPISQLNSNFLEKSRDFFYQIYGPTEDDYDLEYRIENFQDELREFLKNHNK